jgi:hypothetical protein
MTIHAKVRTTTLVSSGSITMKITSGCQLGRQRRKVQASA